MLELAMKWAGVVFTFAVSAAILMMIWCYISDRLEKVKDKRRWRALDLAKRELGQRLIQDSYWFSHNKEAFKVLYLLGKELCQNGGYDINAFRKTVEDIETSTFEP